MLDVHVAEYQMLDGSKKTLIKQVGNGSIIKRFEATPLPRKSTDIVCPHFLELKWALGCPFNCAWCYLQGTLRFYLRQKKPTYRSYEEIERHVCRLFRAEYPNEREVLNTGEIADSLMSEHTSKPFSTFVVPLFETQHRYKVLFLTKSNYVANLLKIDTHDKVIMSFSTNADPVARRWEKAPSVAERIKAAKKVSEAGYETRIRIDPIVPYPETAWQEHYMNLIDHIFLSGFVPERVTLGSLRGLQSTINEAKDKSWVKYLEEPSKWGRRIPFKLRQKTFSILMNYLEEKYGYQKVALCKEPVEMWESLGMNWKRCKCNCVW